MSVRRSVLRPSQTALLPVSALHRNQLNYDQILMAEPVTLVKFAALTICLLGLQVLARQRVN